MEQKEYLTYNERIKYNKGRPIRCTCGRIIGFERDGEIYIICRSCKGAEHICKATSH